MKKIIVTLLSLVMVLTLSVCAFADNDSFDPTLKVETSDDGKTITVTMNELPDGVSAEMTIPCDGWEWATVKDSSGKTVEATFGEVDTNPDPEVEQLVDAVTFDAVGGTYTITKSSAPSGGTPGGYYPIVTPTTPVEKPADTKPTTPAQPTTPPAEVTVPVSGEENTINVEASVSGSTATIDKVDMTKLEGVIGDDVAVGTVTIDFSVLESAEVIDTVEIPSEVVKEIAEAVADPNNDAESLEIILSDGASIEFDAAALAEKAAQAGGTDITISIKQAVENVLSAAQQAAVGDCVAFDINVTSGGVHISDMGGKITIHAPYELRDGETAEGIVVYYVDDEGNKEKCETSYDSVKKRVNWKTDHLSVYMIAHEAPATDDAPAVDNTPADDITPSDSGNSVGLWIGVALAVLVVAIIVVMILIKRKKA